MLESYTLTTKTKQDLHKQLTPQGWEENKTCQIYLTEVRIFLYNNLGQIIKTGVFLQLSLFPLMLSLEKYYNF